jgi:uncharacterized membrane protein YphA (DoxX/SURF4 family)
MRIIKFICRIVAGLVFIYSGTVKAIDPLGSAYKFHDYFLAFNLDLLQPLSLPLAILLFTAEFLAGFSVLTGIRAKEGIWGLFLLIVFFTPLTLILALTNPVSDCGCFGDAIHLTNWQTFGKNVILLILILILFSGRRKTVASFRPLTEWIITGTVIILFTGFAVFNLIFLPVIDFLPYNVGTHIRDKMIIPEGASVNQYETTFIYEKDGEQKEFTLQDYPGNDTSWKFVEQKSLLIKKGYEPPIHDFTVTTLDNYDITDSVLDDPGYTLLMIARRLELSKPSRLEKGYVAGMECLSEGIAFYILTASGTDEAKRNKSGLPVCQTDETTLKTMIRSNPGYILLKNGTILDKWSWANLPENLAQQIKQDKTGTR